MRPFWFQGQIKGGNENRNLEHTNGEEMFLTTPAMILAPVFLVVFLCTRFALEHTELRDVKGVLSLAVSTLCVLGLLRGGGEKEPLIDTVLIPYEALAFLLMFLVIPWLLARATLWIRKVHANWLRQAEEERGRFETITVERENPKKPTARHHLKDRTKHS